MAGCVKTGVTWPSRRSVIAIVSGSAVGNRFLLGLPKRWVVISKKISEVVSAFGGSSVERL